jgi:hypothetical protein
MGKLFLKLPVPQMVSTLATQRSVSWSVSLPLGTFGELNVNNFSGYSHFEARQLRIQEACVTSRLMYRKPMKQLK